MKKIIALYKKLHIAVKASLWFTIASLFQKGLTFLATPIYTRLLSTESYGFYSVYISWLSVITIFATLSLSAGVLNNALLNKEKFGLNDNQVLFNFQIIETITIPIVMGIVMMFKYLFPSIISLPFNSLVAMAISIFFSSGISLWTIKERYNFKYIGVTILTILLSVLTVFFNIIFVYYLNDSSFALVYGSTLAIVIVNFFIIVRNIVNGSNGFNWDICKYAICFNLPLIPHYLASTILTSADKIMIESMRSSSDAALYSVAYSLGNILTVFINAINASLAPYTYQKLKKGETEEIRKFTTTVFLLLILIAGIVIMVGPELIYILGGEKYIEAKWVIPPIAAAIVFFFMYPMFANIEFYYEKRIMTMIASIMAAILNIILNYICIPIFGYIAAAFTTLICYIALSIFHYIMYRIICKQKRLGKIYDEKILIVLSLFTLLLIGCSYVVYMYNIIRYVFIIIIIILIVINRKKLLNCVKNIAKK